jgi:hypothetical protein
MSSRAPAASQAVSCAQAARTTQWVNGSITAEDSANGMNSSGETVPRTGCCQRISASTPPISPESSHTFGW